jgi:hypothetical protein
MNWPGRHTHSNTIQSNPSNFFAGVTILKESDQASEDFAGAMTIWQQSQKSGSNEPDRKPQPVSSGHKLTQ